MLFSFAMLSAQAPTASNGAAFEVASVKANTSGDLTGADSGAAGTVGGDERSAARDHSLRVSAAGLSRSPAGPAGSSEHFDIVANAEENVAERAVRMMLRALLADRFKLVAHHETARVPVFALVLARSDGHLGERLRRSTLRARRARAARRRDLSVRPDAVRRIMGRTADVIDPVGHPRVPRRCRWTRSQLSADAADPASGRRSARARRRFDLDVDVRRRRSFRGRHRRPECRDRVDRSGVSIDLYGAQDQLGLKLDRRRSGRRCTVIDSIERPVED